MRIHISPVRDGRREAMIVPGRRAHLAPLLIREGSREDFLAEVASAAAKVRLAEASRAPVVPG